MSDRVNIDELRTLLATEGKTDDDAVLDFYAWQDANEMADAFMDDSDGLAELLADYVRGRITPATIANVKAWLDEFFDPDAVGCTREDLFRLIAEYKS